MVWRATHTVPNPNEDLVEMRTSEQMLGSPPRQGLARLELWASNKHLARQSGRPSKDLTTGLGEMGRPATKARLSEGWTLILGKMARIAPQAGKRDLNFRSHSCGSTATKAGLSKA